MGEDSRPADENRLAALRDTGLSAVAAPEMDRFARLVTRLLDVPVGLVSLIEPDRQVLPGLVGLGEPWASIRQTPLSHALYEPGLPGKPLVLKDARADEQWRTHRAVTDLALVAYAAMPLTDMQDHVLGSLCAIDTVPRDWTDAQLSDLAALAAACSSELRLRIASRHSARAHALAEDAGVRAGALTTTARAALARSELMLRVADGLADTTGLPAVRRRVSELITSDLEPSYIGLFLVDGSRLRRVVTEHRNRARIENLPQSYRLDDNLPAARAARANTTIVIQGPEDLTAYGDDAVGAWTRAGLRSAICVPLSGIRLPLGTLVIGWDAPHEIDVLERAVVTALAGYTARAVERALYVDHRVLVARQLQEAMLTDLPAIAGLDLAALYRPAATGELVGGDWYDAYRLPGTEHAAGVSLAATIGDVTGHDMGAATLMGQLRSMLRQADLDHPGAGPATTVSALEHANLALGLGASGTLVHTHLRPLRDGNWDLTWTNAGHPPPLLRQPDGNVEPLHLSDAMIDPSLPQHRRDHRRKLSPGSTLLLYTDGLVERREFDIDAGIAHAAKLLAEYARPDLPEVLEILADRVAGPEPDDDIALIAIRVPV